MRFQRRVITLVAAAFLIAVTAVSLEAQPLQFGISPGEIELVPAPGGTATGVLVVMNHSAYRVHFTVKVADIYIRPTGELSLVESGSVDWSVVKLARVMPAEFDLDSNQQMPVKVTVTVPADARGGRYGAIVVSPNPILQAGAGLRGTVSVIVPKLAARLLVPVRGTEVVRGAIVNMLAAPKPAGKGADVKIAFRNTGNVHVKASGDLLIFDPAGQQVAKLPIPEALVLPGSLREFRMSWEAKGLEPGTYTVRAVMDYGADVLVAGEVGFTYRKP